MSLAWSLMASSRTMLSSLRTGAASAISIRLSRSMLVSRARSRTSSASVLQLVDDVDDALFLAGVALGDGLRRSASAGASMAIDFVDAEEVAQVVEGRQVVRVADGDGQHVVLEGRAAASCRRWPSSRGRAAAPRACGLTSSRLTTLRPCCSARAWSSCSSVIRPRSTATWPSGMAGALGLVEHLPELVFVDEAEIDEDLAESCALPRADRVVLAWPASWPAGGRLLGGGPAVGGLPAAAWPRLAGLPRRRLGARLGRRLGLAGGGRCLAPAWRPAFARRAGGFRGGRVFGGSGIVRRARLRADRLARAAEQRLLA